MSTPLKASTCTQHNFIDVLRRCGERFKTVRVSSFSKRFIEFSTGSFSCLLRYSSFRFVNRFTTASQPFFRFRPSYSSSRPQGSKSTWKKQISEILLFVDFQPPRQGVRKRCRLSLLTNSALVYEPQCGGRGRGCGASANEYTAVHITWHGVQINFLCSSPWKPPPPRCALIQAAVALAAHVEKMMNSEPNL
jgi:hypothetical protein